MAVSVIVSNFNGVRFLPRLLETLQAQRGVTSEIIVVDRNSTDGSAEILAMHPAVRVVKEPPESGLVAGYHVGSKQARHENLFFCNEDMWFETDCLRRIESHIDLAARVAAVMPIQRTYDGKGLVNGGLWFLRGWDRANPYPFRTVETEPPSRPVRLSGVNAGACLINRRAYDDCEGWDTTFFLDYEDMDLSIRMWQRGWHAMIDPRAIVYHAVGASNEKRINAGRTRVGRKRYVAAASNQYAIVVKTFSLHWLLTLPFLLFVDRFARHLLRFRLRLAWFEIEAVGKTFGRLAKLLRYRGANAASNAAAPGQSWFTQDRFDYRKAER